MRIIENLTKVIEYYKSLPANEKAKVDANRKKLVAKLTKAGATVCILSTLLTSCVTAKSIENLSNKFNNKDKTEVTTSNIVTKVTENEVGNTSVSETTNTETIDPNDNTPTVGTIYDEEPLYSTPNVTTSTPSDVAGADTTTTNEPATIAPETDEFEPEKTLQPTETTTATSTSKTTSSTTKATETTTASTKKTSTTSNNSDSALDAVENFNTKLINLLNSKLNDYYVSKYSNLDANYQPEVVEVVDISADETAIGFDFYGKTANGSTTQYYKLRLNTNGTSLQKYAKKFVNNELSANEIDAFYTAIKNSLSSVSLANMHITSYNLIDCEKITTNFDIPNNYETALVYFKSSTATKSNNTYNYTAYLEVIGDNTQILTITISSNSRLSQSNFKTAVKNYVESGSTKMESVTASVSATQTVQIGANETLKANSNADVGLSL